MTKLKKLLYLLQLEEYQTSRYLNWLAKNDIENLVENKGKLKWTLRIKLTYYLSLLLSAFFPLEKSVAFSNNLLAKTFKQVENFIILLAKIKMSTRPDLITIVITGSYGKTSFKELLAFILEEKYQVLKTSENKNTLLAIAQTILKSLNRNHQIFIVEAGAYKKGEIREICLLVKPTFGIITVIGWMHLERFGTIDNIRQTKFELADFIKDKSKLFSPKNIHEFIDFESTINKIGQILGVDETAVKTKFSQFISPEHRLTIRSLSKNITIIDDAYNSNPIGFTKALDELKKYSKDQKIVVTPGMIELGEMQFKLNQQAAQETAKKANILAIVGQTNQKALSSVQNPPKSFKIIYLNKGEKIEEGLSAYLRPPTVILLENDLPDHYF